MVLDGFKVRNNVIFQKMYSKIMHVNIVQCEKVPRKTSDFKGNLWLERYNMQTKLIYFLNVWKIKIMISEWL